MFGIGYQELIILLLLAVIVFGIVMTVDSIRRPSSQYRLGQKSLWITVLLISNPLLTRFLGGLLWVGSLLVFVTASVVYYAKNRRHNPIHKTVPGHPT